jgi:hypothetical protein
MTGLYDVDYDILLKSDINTIEKLCFVNKYFDHICQNDQFWYYKFNADKLPLPIIRPTSTFGWVKIYKHQLKLKQLKSYMYMNEFEPELNRDIVGYMQSFI